MNTPVLQPWPICEATERPKWSGHYTDHGVVGYVRYPFEWLPLKMIPVHSFRLNEDFPACLSSSDGRTYRAEMRGRTDGGSIPFIVQFIGILIPFISLARDQHPLSFYFHDDLCRTGRVRVLSFVDGSISQWTIEPITRKKTDWLLREALRAEARDTLAEMPVATRWDRARKWLLGVALSVETFLICFGVDLRRVVVEAIRAMRQQRTKEE